MYDAHTIKTHPSSKLPHTNFYQIPNCFIKHNKPDIGGKKFIALKNYFFNNKSLAVQSYQVTYQGPFNGCFKAEPQFWVVSHKRAVDSWCYMNFDLSYDEMGETNSASANINKTATK